MKKRFEPQNKKVAETQLYKLLDFILYGDIHEVPIDSLNDLRPSDIDTLDDEQLTRVAIAASIKRMVLNDEIILSGA